MPQSVPRPTGPPRPTGYARPPGAANRFTVPRRRAGARRMASTTDGTVRPPQRREQDGADAAGATRELRTDQLLSAVENELIPRLLVAHAAAVSAAEGRADPGSGQGPASGPWASEAEVRRFAALCLEDEADRLNRCVSELLSRGVGLDAVYLHLAAPAARRLGELWSADELGFVEVQLGLSRLHRLVRECNTIGARHEPAPDGGGTERSILLATAPGDQHTFGVALAADFFERRGWLVTNLAGLDREALLEDVATVRYSAVGLSLHNEEFAAPLAGLVRALRERSANPDVLVLLGGDFFARHPERGADTGADLVAGDAPKAIRDAERLLLARAEAAR